MVPEAQTAVCHMCPYCFLYFYVLRCVESEVSGDIWWFHRVIFPCLRTSPWWKAQPILVAALPHCCRISHAAAVEDMALFGATHPDAETLLPQAISIHKPSIGHPVTSKNPAVLSLLRPFFHVFCHPFVAIKNIKTDHIRLNPVCRR